MTQTNKPKGYNVMNVESYISEYENEEVSIVPQSNYSLYADYAYQVQKQTQQRVLDLVKNVNFIALQSIIYYTSIFYTGVLVYFFVNKFNISRIRIFYNVKICSYNVWCY